MNVPFISTQVIIKWIIGQKHIVKLFSMAMEHDHTLSCDHYIYSLNPTSAITNMTKVDETISVRQI